jgi:hypothetical protein
MMDSTRHHGLRRLTNAVSAPAGVSSGEPEGASAAKSDSARGVLGGKGPMAVQEQRASFFVRQV